MNTRRIKTLCAVAAFTLAQLGVRDVYVHFQQHSEPAHSMSEEKLATALSAIEETDSKPSLHVTYAAVRQGYHEFNWTGVLPVSAQPLDTTAKQEEIRLPVSELIHVLMLRVDTDDSQASVASISYRHAANFPPRMAAAGQDLRAGDTLLAPHAWAKVVGVTLDGIEFSFDEEGRENELVAPALAANGETRVIHNDGVSLETLDAWSAHQVTTEPRANRFRLETNDRQQLASNYPTILSRDIQHRRHFNTQTRRYDGIEIQSVTPGSFAARHGATSGDIIRSINGHPVSSVAEAVAFVREHEGEHTTWEVKIENQGRKRTVTYEVPSQS